MPRSYGLTPRHPIAAGIDGYIEGSRMREEDDYRREQRAIQTETQQLGLDAARRESMFPNRVRQVMDKYRTQAGNVEDAAGNVTEGRVPKEMSLSDQLAMYAEIGALFFDAGKMSQKDFMELPRKIQAYKQEGIFDAVKAMRNAGSIEEGVKAFNKLGGVKIKSFTTREARDSLTGLPTSEVTIRTEDDQYDTFNLAELARDVGTAEKYLDWAKVGVTGRRAAADERRNDLTERRLDQQYDLGLATIDQRDRAAELRAERGGGGGVTEWKYKAWLDVYPGDRQGALNFAAGRKTLSNAEARKFAEGVAARLKDSAGLQLSRADRQKEADLVYARIIAEQGAGSGAPQNPRPAAGTGDRPPLDSFMR
jgi:hypothetical protein